MRTKAIVPDHEFKLGMRQVVSSVAIVTSRAGGVRNGLTATAVCSVSADPPTVLACVNRNASAEALIAESGNFAINFLTEDQHNIARLFSKSKLDADQRFGRRKLAVDGHRFADPRRRGGELRLRGARSESRRPPIISMSGASWPWPRPTRTRCSIAMACFANLRCPIKRGRPVGQPQFQRHPREGGDPVSQSASDLVTSAAEYWMPACAGMTAETRSKLATL